MRDAIAATANTTEPLTGVGGATRGRESDTSRAGFVQIFPRDPLQGPRIFVAAGAGSIGRSSKADFVLPDPKLSRRHAHVRRTGEGFEVKDLESRNGTFVNGSPVPTEGTVVRYGGIVRVGHTLLLAARDVEFYATRPRRIPGASLGMPSDLVGGPLLSEVWDRATALAQGHEPLLVLGESGAGKEVIARLVHRARSPDGPFVALNAAAIPKALFEAEMFGHKRGVFTGATTERLGAFREAHKGVLFLDEVGEIESEMQTKLLRVLDDLKVRPLGGGEFRVDTLVVAATNRDLGVAAKAGRFREDLLFRLSAREVIVPSLRERPDDVLLIAQSFLTARPTPLDLSVQAAESLAVSPWPGNTRSLHRALTWAAERVRTRSQCVIEADDLPAHDSAVDTEDEPQELTAAGLRSAVARAKGNVAQAAANLGISRSTFYAACRRLSVEPKNLRIR